MLDVATNDEGYPTESLTGLTFTFVGVVGPGNVEVPKFRTEVLSSCWYFNHVNMVEVRVPGLGRRTISVDHIPGLRY